MDDYAIGYEKGYNAAMYIDVGIWVLIGFFLARFLVKKMYEKDEVSSADIKTKRFIVIAVTLAFGLVRAFMVFL